MPVIKVNRQDFCKLVGKELSMEFVEKTLPMLGVAWEGKEGDEFSVEVFPNRPDMLSVEGLARAFASFIGLKPGLKKYEAKSFDYMVIVDNRVANVRPFIASAVAKGVEFTDDFITSIMQLQEKLHVTHGRKRRKVAIGLHDLSKITFPVVYTTKPKDFRFIPLGFEEELTLEEILKVHPKGREYGWILDGYDEYPILIDAKNMVLSMPPIINSCHTMLTEQTTGVFFDVTGTDMKAVEEVLNILVTTFADRGAEIFSVEVRYGVQAISYPRFEPKKMEVDASYISKLLGLNLPAVEIAKLLERMGYGVEVRGGKLLVLIPCYRTDIMHPIDVAEDVAIAYGYDKLEPELPNIASVASEDRRERFFNLVRSFMVGFGLQEVKTFILTSEEKLFKLLGREKGKVVELENPKTTEFTVARDTLVPSMLEILRRNRKNEYPQNLFEVGKALVVDESKENKVKELNLLCVALCHARANFSEIKSLVEALMKNFGISYEIKEGKRPFIVDGRCAELLVGGASVGYLGEIKPEVLNAWQVYMPVAVCELNLDELVHESKP